MIFLKADTAVEVLVGPALAVGDGFTPVTNLVGASADEYEILKFNGATKLVAAAPTNALSGITGADGYYSLEFATGDLDTEGMLYLIINDDSLVLPIRHEFMVVAANVYDSLFAVAGTDVLDVNTVEWLATAVTLGSGAPDVNIQSTDDIDLSATQKTSVNTEADTALTDIFLDKLFAVSVADEIVNDSAWADLVSTTGDWSTFVKGTDSLQAIRDRGDTDWITGAGGTGLTPLDSGTLESG